MILLLIYYLLFEMWIFKAFKNSFGSWRFRPEIYDVICQTDTELTFMAASYAGRMMLLSLLVGQTLSGFVIISFTVLNLISVITVHCCLLWNSSFLRMSKAKIHRCVSRCQGYFYESIRECLRWSNRKFLWKWQ